MFVIDIAVPRDIETAVNELDNVYLYNIDDLQEVADRNLDARRAEVDRCLEFVEAETTKRPNRSDHAFTWKLSGFEVAEGTYRYRVRIQGDLVGGLPHRPDRRDHSRRDHAVGHRQSRRGLPRLIQLRNRWLRQPMTRMGIGFAWGSIPKSRDSDTSPRAKVMRPVLSGASTPGAA